MRLITTRMIAVALIMLASVVAASGQGSDRAKERRGFDTPPGLEAGQGSDRAKEGRGFDTAPGLEAKAVAVPDTGSTLTLLSLALGGGVLVRGWVSRRDQRGSRKLPSR